jgi:hypothetical protein
VEQVKTGSTLRVYIPATGDEFTVNLSGVHCPIYRFNDESASEPFSREAKFFTEFCLLNRDVIVTLESMDKINNYFGTVIDTVGKRNVASNLIALGLGSFVEWNAPIAHTAEWQEAEKIAKENKLRMWRKWKAEAAAKPAGAGSTGGASTSVTAKEFLGTVVEIVNAGAIVVRVQKGDATVDVNVNFSSIRVPRLGANKGGEKEPEAPAKDPAAMTEREKKVAQEKKLKLEEEKIQHAYAVQGKEFLRKGTPVFFFLYGGRGGSELDSEYGYFSFIALFFFSLLTRQQN